MNKKQKFNNLNEFRKIIADVKKVCNVADMAFSINVKQMQSISFIINIKKDSNTVDNDIEKNLKASGYNVVKLDYYHDSIGKKGNIYFIPDHGIAVIFFLNKQFITNYDCPPLSVIRYKYKIGFEHDFNNIVQDNKIANN